MGQADSHREAVLDLLGSDDSHHDIGIRCLVWYSKSDQNMGKTERKESEGGRKVGERKDYDAAVRSFCLRLKLEMRELKQRLDLDDYACELQNFDK